MFLLLLVPLALSLCAFSLALYFLWPALLRQPRFVFDERMLREIFAEAAAAGIGDKASSGSNSQEAAEAAIVKLRDLLERRLGLPNDSKSGQNGQSSPKWVLNYAYGIQCPLLILYASPFEYILVWGTPSGNEGGTGRHRLVTFFDTVLSGSVLYWSEENPLRPYEFTTGDHWVHRPGDCGGQRIVDSAWCVEYARGFLPSLLPFGLVSTIVTLDVTALVQLLKLYAVLNMRAQRLGAAIARQTEEWRAGDGRNAAPVAVAEPAPAHLRRGARTGKKTD
jgi:C-8 sterol isomerase